MIYETIRQALHEGRDESGVSAHSLLVTAVWLMAAFVSGLSLTSFNASSTGEAEASQTRKPTKCQPWEFQKVNGGGAGGTGWTGVGSGAGGMGVGSGASGVGVGSGASGVGVSSGVGADAGSGSGCLAACHSILRNLEANVLQSVNNLEASPESESEPRPDSLSRTRLDWPFGLLSEDMPEVPSHEPPPTSPGESDAADTVESPLSHVAVKVADQHDGCVIYNTATAEVYFDSRQN